VRQDKRCVRNNTRDLAPIPNGSQVAVNLIAVPLRREKPCVIIHWPEFRTGWQQRVSS
jgi:hypothetical protein